MGKARINAYVSDEIRRESILLLERTESLSEFVEKALRAEIERRQTKSGPAPASPLRLPRGRRPK